MVWCAGSATEWQRLTRQLVNTGTFARLSEGAKPELAHRYGRTPAQVLLRWHIEFGLVPVPKSEDPQRLRENIAVFDFTLTPEDVARLSALDRGDKLVLDPETFGHGAGPTGP